MSMNISTTITLNNGVKLPVLGLGTWQTPDGHVVEQAVRWALEAGYKHIDTAAVYGNEKGVGDGIRSSGVDRKDVFVTTKLWNESIRRGYDASMAAFDESLAKLGFDYVDLYLIHWPVKGKYKEAWRVLEKIYAEGRARAIGVSNFLIHHLQDVMQDAKVMPAVNQIEFHPWVQSKPLIDFCAKNNIVVEAWSPLMQGKVGEVPQLVQIAQRIGKTPAQVVLRWNLQRGLVTIPKSVKRERILENAALFDFELSEADMRAIDAVDQDKRIGPHPDTITF